MKRNRLRHDKSQIFCLIDYSSIINQILKNKNYFLDYFCLTNF